MIVNETIETLMAQIPQSRVGTGHHRRAGGGRFDQAHLTDASAHLSITKRDDGLLRCHLDFQLPLQHEVEKGLRLPLFNEPFSLVQEKNLPVDLERSPVVSGKVGQNTESRESG